jgi:coenzyme PQQ biosynthesis protein PqqD
VKLGLRPKVRCVRRQPTGAALLVYPERALELNPSAEEVVALLDGTREEADIVRLLGARHPETEPGRIRADVASLLSELEARGLLERVP